MSGRILNDLRAVVRAAVQQKGGSPEDARQEVGHMLNIPAKELQHNHPAIQNYVGNGDFAKKLRWKIGNPQNVAETWAITPAMASIMLTWNDRNRPLAESTVKKYAALMRQGRWRYTGEPIIFSPVRLIDGQHRLAACVAANTPIDALVVFGAPDEAFAFIDVGKSRTAANIFAINGVKNYVVIAAAIQWVIGYEADRHAAAARGDISKGDHDLLYQAYLNHTGLQDSVWVAQVFMKAKIVSPSLMCATHYVCAQKNRHQADEFFRKVGEGIGFTGKKDPAYKLHKHFVDAAVSQQSVGRRAATALTVKAWNATRRGRDVGVLRFTPDEPFPRAI